MVSSKHSSPHLPLWKAVTWIALSCVMVSGSLSLGWVLWTRNLGMRQHDGRYCVTHLAQSCSEPHRLTNTYLAELLQLSYDEPDNIYRFDATLAHERLLSSPVIAEASVQTYAPNIVHVRYSTYEPIAYLGDISNTTIDVYGRLAPSQPYFTPKKLPVLYLGLERDRDPESLWGSCVGCGQFSLAVDVLRALQALSGFENSSDVYIDVSLATAESYGKRQIVATWTENIEVVGDQGLVLCRMPRVLRLSPRRYQEALDDYARIQGYLAEQQSQGIEGETSSVDCPERIVDMRISKLAFLSDGK